MSAVKLTPKQRAMLCSIPRSAVGLLVEFHKEEHQTALELQKLGYLEGVPLLLGDEWFEARVLKH